jgi:mannose-6-phosphate isomerase-like protein (cupin superfamily)
MLLARPRRSPRITVDREGNGAYRSAMSRASSDGGIAHAEIVLGCDERSFSLSLEFFTDTLGFRLFSIEPADDPTSAVLSGYGLRLRLERGGLPSPVTLRLSCADPRAIADGATSLVAPNGVRIELVPVAPPLAAPPLVSAFAISRVRDARWIEGRAGMSYRDLIADRQGGLFVASHIRIERAGPVADYVHHHDVFFQVIYCHRGWVRVVYEDQGAPFVLREGEAVLQPPGIRHRVLECSAALEVIEITSPARHPTFAEHELTLPSAELRPDREYRGQRFVHSAGAAPEWRASRHRGFEARELGVAAASAGLACVSIVRGGGAERTYRHDGELAFFFVLEGELGLRVDRERVRLSEGDAVVVPRDAPYAIESSACTFLEAVAPAALRAAEAESAP